LNSSTAVSAKTRASKESTKVTSVVRVSDATIARLSEVFKLMADKSRLKILLALAHEGEMHVSALCELLGQSQPAVSHHLTLMRMTGLVGFRRDGKHNFYHLDSGLLRDLLEQFFADSGNGQKQIHFEEFSLSYRRR
jgi:ArsR family transcriptional regulator